MPIHLVGLGARLFLQLLHHRLHGDEVFLFGIELVHAGDEMARPDVVKVVVEQVVASDVALGIDHSVGVFTTVSENGVASVFQICVEHAFQFDAHDIAPFRFCRKVEQI